MNVLFLGQATSGKGTQSKILAEKFGMRVVGMGYILRQHKKDNTDIGKLAKELDAKGELMHESVIISILTEEYEKGGNIIFDGAVRSVEQAKRILSLHERDDKELLVIYINISDETALERSLARFTTSNRVEDSDTKIIQRRIDIFNSDIDNILDEFREIGYFKINGERTVEQVTDRLENIIGHEMD